MHKKLARTIAKPGSLEKLNEPSVYAMNCHLTACGDKEFCVGWLYNQLGEGSNIPLRIHMIENYKDWGDLKVVGEQHATFKDTLPKDYKQLSCKYKKY
ncbi:hypothetical protein [Chitinophaga japonensis]|uniref:hypothetical protein n=1 Tax=Chitinophaga japonensis TaxID=104662 RepID=UPI0011A52CC1|nr:hypothetical protein [Chitinophaga japonensis]